MYEGLKKNTYRKDGNNPLGLERFGLTVEQTEILYNFEYFKILNDIDSTKVPLKEDKIVDLKKEWVEEWKKYMELGFPCIDSYWFPSLPRFAVATLEMTQLAYDAIESFAKEKGISIEVVYLSQPHKAFDEDYIFNSEECEERKKEYIEICKKKVISYVLGRKNSELLIAFEDNTPNNTLGLLWYSTDKYDALFRRRKKEITNLRRMQVEKQKRIKQNRTEIVRMKKDGIYILQLACYLVRKDDKLDFSEVMKEFGMNDEQLDVAIKNLFKNDYLELRGGSFYPSSRLKELVKISKLECLDVAGEEEKVEVKRTNYFPANFGTVFSGYK